MQVRDGKRWQPRFSRSQVDLLATFTVESRWLSKPFPRLSAKSGERLRS
ncbi:hypothetical protein KCP73_19270 [Salmonella enterica subsp. enterica]|nr:hypothetical protein KCP73_19270 [Salmonella enterica subsp. enterica]